MNAPSDQCNLVHTGSVERLIMSNDQVNFILNLIAMGTNVGPVDKANIPLKSISRYIRIDNATTSHPLFSVLQNLKSVTDETTGKIVKVDGVSVTLTRDESGYLPRAGREVYLKATLGLKTSKGASEVITVGSTPLTVTSQIVIYPREVGSFALLVPKDLHLDKTYNAGMATGDVALHMFGSKSEVGGGQGLVFLSPVFVNQDIYLPPDTGSGSKSASGNYAAVTFADRVYLGNGWVKNSNGGQFVPRSSGGLSDRYWSDLTTFGGFLRGIENDGGLDKGLQVFGKVVSGSKPDAGLMSKCIERSQNMSSATYLYKSQLATNLRSNSKNNPKYRLFLDKGNKFSYQGDVPQPTTTNFGSGTVSRKGSTGGAMVMTLTFILGDRIVTAPMTATSTLTITPEVGSPEYKAQLQAALSSAQTALKLAKDKGDSLEVSLASAKSALTKAKKDLETEEAKPVKPAPTPEPTPMPTPDLNITPTPSPTVSPTPEEDATPSDSPTPAPSPTSTPIIMVGPTPKPTPVPKGYYQDPDVIASLKSQIQTLQATIDQLQSSDVPNQQTIITSATQAVQQAQDALSVFNNPPQFVIQMSPVNAKFNSVSSVDMEITASNIQNLLDAKGNLMKPSIGIQAYDSTYYRTVPIKNPPNTNLLRYLNFTFSADKKSLVAPEAMALTSTSGALATVADDADDYDSLDLLCEEARNASASQSFGGAGWDVDFSGATRSSWNFAGDGSSVAGHDPAFDKTLLLDSGADGVFKVYSIAKECVIAASASLITGFYTCDSLRIEARQNPLRIIGTFIVGKMQIDPSAYKAGITWSSIYHPQVTQELRAAGVLKSVSGTSCTAQKSPICKSRAIPVDRGGSGLRSGFGGVKYDM
jgi:hypothetical protein